MKLAVRALVLGLLLTGFAADHMLATKSAPANASTMVASMSANPVPSCQPGRSTCGFDR